MVEEVRSYWQVASITHFCNLFGKPFKLPTFEPEELEQAFIIDVPEPPKTSISNHNNHIITFEIEDSNQSDKDLGKDNHNGSSSSKIDQGDDRTDNEDETQQNDVEEESQKGLDDDPSFQPPKSLASNNFPPPSTQPQNDEQQQEMHLLVKLGIALLKPHFSTKLTPTNWENYLRRIVDTYWVELEQYPSPFRVPIISSEGIELTKNLTFNELSLSDKIDLFYALCDYRLWCEDTSEAIKDYPLEELRLESIGKDTQGFEYWYFSGTRLFREDKELSQDLVLRKKRIKELEYKIIELERSKILKEQEEKRKAELEQARQLAIEEREARLAAKKRHQEQDSANNDNKNKKRRTNTPILPPRTGLRERRTSSTSNNNDSQATQQETRTPTLRSRVTRQSYGQQPQQQRQSAQKGARGSAKNSKNNNSNDQKPKSPEVPKKDPLEECKEELEKIAIKPEDRAASWSIHCESLEEWESFATRFEKTKSTNEKNLVAYVNQEILPKIQAIYAKRAAEIRRKEKELMFSLTSRRVSTRIISKRAQEEEEERRAQQREAELLKRKAEAETRLRAELEREIRAKKNRERFVINGGASSTCSEDGGVNNEDSNTRYNLRQQPQQQHLTSGQLLDLYDDMHEFDGIIHPDKLSDFYEALELIIDTVKTSKHAWPFVDPVPETVPGYYDLIEEPMDLKKLRTKVEFREYRSLIELEKDFQLLVNNCEKFNGPKNVYTKMVYKLWKSFRKNVRLYLQRDLHMDEYETFIYPPPAPVVQSNPEPEPEPKPEVGLGTKAEPNLDYHVKTEIVDEINGEKEHEVKEERVEATDAVYVQNQNGFEQSPKPFVEVNTKPLEQQLLPPPPPLSEQALDEFQNGFDQPPEPVVEEIIIDSYAIPCPGENIFVWPEDAKSIGHEQNQ